ncbi:hypothetical protein C491_17474 [Natronococcus amylolyticus DSM 10524]|uniref:DUF7344 domain-containing protein n=1 Tax=Natronococcus amylolyticus DSM 10524 TaxID=1227497 RepID=L9WZM1_9EURY|nr:hypothetical protein [Natronococcus amylolyticus]ELY54910.1 hypothetical protein C491_17474 [Natronococcus amylolyticus DSM 10524]
MNQHEAFEILADADRQHILYELVENDGVSTVSDLSQRIASCSDTAHETAFKHAKVSLVHNHLPRLEHYGVLEYDTRSGDVVLTDTGSVEPILNAAEEVERTVAGAAQSI